MLKKLLDELDLISRFDQGEYEMIENPQVDFVTPKAVLINDRWITKAYLRTDFDGNIYLQNWLYSRIF